MADQSKTDKILENKYRQLVLRCQMYEDCLDRIIQGVIILDSEERVIWFNKVVSEQEGIKLTDVVGKKESDVWNLPVSSASEALQTGKPTDEYYLDYYTINGKKRNIFTTTYPFIANKRCIWAFGIAYYLDYSEYQLAKVCEYRRKYLEQNARFPNDTRFHLGNILGQSAVMRKLIDDARKVARTNIPVLLCGETGTGKELLAQGIHNASLAQEGKFVAVNCAAIPENLLETTLFGSVKGAYTGAVDKPGLFEIAQHNGTLFLDELNSLSLTIQSKFLRVLEEKQFSRIGDNKLIDTNCRIISAVNQNIWELVKKGVLRQDLFFRISNVMLQLPPLRERKDDILDLVQFFIAKHNKEYHKEVAGIDTNCKKIFHQYSWPGNVRELDHVVAYMMNITSETAYLTSADLPQYLSNFLRIRGPQRRYHEEILESGLPLQEMMLEIEREILIHTLKKNNGNITHTAKQLQISRESLHYRISKYCIDPKTLKQITNK